MKYQKKYQLISAEETKQFLPMINWSLEEDKIQMINLQTFIQHRQNTKTSHTMYSLTCSLLINGNHKHIISCKESLMGAMNDFKEQWGALFSSQEKQEN